MKTLILIRVLIELTIIISLLILMQKLQVLQALNIILMVVQFKLLILELNVMVMFLINVNQSKVEDILCQIQL